MNIDVFDWWREYLVRPEDQPLILALVLVLIAITLYVFLYAARVERASAWASHPPQRRRAVGSPSPLAARLLRLAGKCRLWRQRLDRRPQRIDAQYLAGDGIDFCLQAFRLKPRARCFG